MNTIKNIIISVVIAAILTLAYFFFLSEDAMKRREERKKQKKLQQLEAGKPYYKVIDVNSDVRNEDQQPGIHLFFTFQRMRIEELELKEDLNYQPVTIKVEAITAYDNGTVFKKDQVYSSRKFPLTMLMPDIRKKEEELEKK